MMVVSHLVSGFWSLAAGTWLLVSGHWPPRNWWLAAATTWCSILDSRCSMRTGTFRLLLSSIAKRVSSITPQQQLGHRRQV